MTNQNLVIGNTSQLSTYFPKNNFDFISSRNLDFEKIQKKKYDKIFLLFAEQRTFLKDNDSLFFQVNVSYTLDVINRLKDFCRKIVVYSTSELWNKHNGCINLETPYNYFETPYIKSKEMMCNEINKNKKDYNNVVIIYPFNFNSPFRKDGFLFKKIFDSLILNQKIKIGNIDFERDLIHPKIVVEKSISAESDLIIGSGELYNVKQFIVDLYTQTGKNIEEYLEYDDSNNLLNKRNSYYSCIKTSDYNELLNLTKKDIYEYKIG